MNIGRKELIGKTCSDKFKIVEVSENSSTLNLSINGYLFGLTEEVCLCHGYRLTVCCEALQFSKRLESSDYCEGMCLRNVHYPVIVDLLVPCLHEALSDKNKKVNVDILKRDKKEIEIGVRCRTLKNNPAFNLELIKDNLHQFINLFSNDRMYSSYKKEEFLIFPMNLQLINEYVSCVLLNENDYDKVEAIIRGVKRLITDESCKDYHCVVMKFTTDNSLNTDCKKNSPINVYMRGCGNLIEDVLKMICPHESIENTQRYIDKVEEMLEEYA